MGRGERMNTVEPRVKLRTKDPRVSAVTLPIPSRWVIAACSYGAPDADQEEDAQRPLERKIDAALCTTLCGERET